MEKLTQHKTAVLYNEYAEIIETMVVKEGEIISIENKKRNLTENQKKYINKNNELFNFIKENEGDYIHSIYKYNFPFLNELQCLDNGNKNNIHIIRFIVLATHLKFGGKCYDMNNNRIKKSSLKNIWGTSNRNSINETYNKLIDCGYIKEDENMYIIINEDIFKKGKLNNFKELKKSDENITYTRLFSNNIQDMYYNTNERQRKQLANLFKILPFINFKYNIFCLNPKEMNKEKIKFLKWTDLARICGYEDTKQVNRFKKDMLNLEIYKYSTIGQFTTKGNYYICINPKVHYGGDNIEDVNFLYKSFEMFENIK